MIVKSRYSKEGVTGYDDEQAGEAAALCISRILGCSDLMISNIVA
jgi:hypothetical protein